MLRTIAFTVAAFAVAACTTAIAAPQCRDASGKFITCPPKPATPKAPVRCKDAQGKFAKCGTPGAKPI